MANLNGLELAGRPMKINHVTPESQGGGVIPGAMEALDSEDFEGGGIGMTQHGRTQLMAKLAEGHNAGERNVHPRKLSYSKLICVCTTHTQGSQCLRLTSLPSLPALCSATCLIQPMKRKWDGSPISRMTCWTSATSLVTSSISMLTQPHHR